MAELVFRHLDDVPWREVKAQMHGDRRVAVNLKFLETHPNRTVIYTSYDPDLVLERHGHSSDHVIFIPRVPSASAARSARPGRWSSSRTAPPSVPSWPDPRGPS